MNSIISTLNAGSGIDTRALIDQLVGADREARTAPLTLRGDALTARISALGQVRSSLQTIASSLAARVSSGVLGLIPASSDSAASPSSGAAPGRRWRFSSAISVTGWRRPATGGGTADCCRGAGRAEGALTIGFGRRTDLGGGDFIVQRRQRQPDRHHHRRRPTTA